MVYFYLADQIDSSSSSRSRSVIMPTTNHTESSVSHAAPSRFSTSTRLSSSRFSGGAGLNDSGVSSGCTTSGGIPFSEKERNLGRLRFPSSSGVCTNLVSGGLEDCAKRANVRQCSTSTPFQPHTRNYYDHRYG